MAKSPAVSKSDPALATPPEAIDFDKMFDQLAEADKPPVLETKPTKTTVAAPTEPVEPVEPVEPPAAPVESVEPPAAPAEPVELPKEPEKPRVSDDEILARFADLVKSRGEQPQPQPQQSQQPQPQQPPELYTPEEKTVLATYEKDWSDVAKAVNIQQRVLAQQLVGYVFNEVANTLRPVIEEVRILSDRAHSGDLHEREPEYDQMLDNVLRWIDTQPSYLKPAYEYVRDHGTPEEVSDLFQRYRLATGAAAPAAPAVRREEPSPVVRKAAASLAPVGTKRSVVIQSNDPNNFDAGFEEAIRSLG